MKKLGTLLLPLLACNPGLRGAPNLGLSLNAYGGARPSLGVYLQYDGDRDTRTCLEFPGLQGSFDGASLPVLSEGGLEDYDEGLRRCAVPGFQMNGPTPWGAQDVLEVSDGTTTLKAQFIPLFTQRVALLTGTDGGIHAGESLSIQFALAGDPPHPAEVLFAPDGGQATWWWSGDAGTQVAVAVPSGVSGAGTLRLATSLAVAPFETAGGARWTALVDDTVDVPIAIGP